MNRQGLHDEPRGYKGTIGITGTTKGNTGNYENKGQYRVPPRTRGSDYTTLTLDFMNKNGLRPCFKAWTTNGNVVRKNPKGELAALRLEFYCTATSVADLEYWNRQVRQFRNGKKTGVWRKGDLQLDFRKGIMNLVDLQGGVWTANEWELLRNGVEAKAGTVAEPEHRKDMQGNAEVACAAGPDTERASELTLTAEASRVNEVEANASKVTEPIEAPAVPGGGPRDQPSTVHEMLLSLIKKLTADQRRILAGELRAVEADVTIDQNRKAELAISFINKLRGDEARASEETSLGEQRSMLEEQTQPDEEMLESSGVDIDNGKKDMGVLAPLEEQQGQESASDVGSTREELWPPGEVTSGGEEQVKAIGDQELLVNDINDIEETSVSHGTADDLLLWEEQMHSEKVMYTGAGLSMSEEGTPDGEIQRVTGIEKKDFPVIEADYMGDELLKDSDEVGDPVKGQSVVMGDLELEEPVIELEEPVILGKIEIGVDVGEPDVVNEYLKVSDTERSKEDPVVGSSTVSGMTMTEIIAGDDVKVKDIGKSGDFQEGGVIRDDSIVSIMSMDYEGCCFQEESMEIQCQERGVVDYDYDDGDTISAKFKYGRPAFAPGGIGMFVVTGRPPGRLIGG